MKTTHLGRTGLNVSRICLGTMNFGDGVFVNARPDIVRIAGRLRARRLVPRLAEAAKAAVNQGWSPPYRSSAQATSGAYRYDGMRTDTMMRLSSPMDRAHMAISAQKSSPFFRRQLHSNFCGVPPAAHRSHSKASSLE